MRVAALTIAIGCGLAAHARAQDAPPDPNVEQARTLFEQGLARADEQRWGEAVEYFRAALELVDRPSIVFNLGVALFRNGQTREAETVLNRFLSRADPIEDGADVAAARRFLGEIRNSYATLVLRVSPASAHVEIDGEPSEGEGATREIEVDPGTHRIVVRADGYYTSRFRMSVLPAGRTERAVELARAPGAPSIVEVTAPDDARVVLDGEEVGAGRVELDVAPGEHTLVVHVPEEPFSRTFEIASGERLLVDATVVEGDVTSSPWFWILLGVGIAGAGVGITVAILAAHPDDPLADYQGSANWTFLALTAPF
jgi:hypothetical protein